MLNKNKTILTVIDFQERLVPAMSSDGLVERAASFIKGAKILGIPILTTQQYTKGLGESVPEIASVLWGKNAPDHGDSMGHIDYIEKTDFSAFTVPEYKDKLEASGKSQIIVCGIEAHVCVLQTALGLIESGYEVFIPEDLVASRTPADKSSAIKRMENAGCTIGTSEMFLFELLRTAKAEHFKDVSALVKNTD